MKIKGCPFCGSEARVGKDLKDYGMNRTGELPEGAVLDKKEPRVKGGYTYHWKRYGYSAWCKNTECIASQMSRVYDTREEAIRSWNRRAYNKCQECKWLTGEVKSIGTECMNPVKQERWDKTTYIQGRLDTRRYKYPHAMACKHFEKGEEA